MPNIREQANNLVNRVQNTGRSLINSCFGGVRSQSPRISQPVQPQPPLQAGLSQRLIEDSLQVFCTSPELLLKSQVPVSSGVDQVTLQPQGPLRSQISSVGSLESQGSIPRVAMQGQRGHNSPFI